MPLSRSDLRPNALITNRGVLYLVTSVDATAPTRGRIASTARIGKDALYEENEPLGEDDLPEFVHCGFGAYVGVKVGDVLRSRAGKYLKVIEVRTDSQPCSMDALARYLTRETEDARGRNMFGQVQALHFADLQHYEVVQELA
ncbi:MAG: hypothetical protein KBE09_05780 [Candidatus Pacebacteria bacterium]|nr:hypothetical protein [Candidatus Paceibacterota bacterium]